MPVCSACWQDLPRDGFSGAQLKRKGKRKCAACVSAGVEQAEGGGGGGAIPGESSVRGGRGGGSHPEEEEEKVPEERVIRACGEGDMALLRRLVRRGVVIGGPLPLLTAAFCGQLTAMRCLVKELGADANQANKDGCTPLYIAAQNGHLDVVRCLVKELGANVNQANKVGSTPLMAAAFQKHEAVVKFLMRHGADAQATMADGRTAIDASAAGGAPPEQTEYLAAKARCASPGCAGQGIRRCGACREAWYCSRPCQTAHWRGEHKRECSRKFGGGSKS